MSKDLWPVVQLVRWLPITARIKLVLAILFSIASVVFDISGSLFILNLILTYFFPGSFLSTGDFYSELRVISGNVPPIVIVYLSMTIIAFIALTKIVSNWFLFSVVFRVTHYVEGRIFKSVLSLKPLERSKFTPSQLSAAIMLKASSLVFNFFIPLLNMVTCIVIILAALLYLLAFEKFNFILVIFIMVVFYIIFASFVSRKLHRVGKIVASQSDVVASLTSSALSCVREIKIFGAEHFFRNQFEVANNRRRTSQAYTNSMNASPRILVEASFLMGFTIFVFIAAGNGVSFSEVIMPIASLVLIAFKMLPLFQNAFSGWTILKSSSTSVADIMRILAAEVDEHNAFECLVTHFNFEQLEMNNVSFRHSDTSDWVIKNFYFHITRGEKLFLTGPSGVGKSTVGDLIMGLCEPTIGSILINGAPLTPSSTDNWQRAISLVSQSVFFTQQSVVENIAFGVRESEIDLDRVKWAAFVACCSDFLSPNDFSMDSRELERCSRLSGGQRQRLAIARAIYRKCQVFVFDEATSGLDCRTEELLVESILYNLPEATIIFISHNKNLCEKFDRTVVMD